MPEKVKDEQFLFVAYEAGFYNEQLGMPFRMKINALHTI